MHGDHGRSGDHAALIILDDAADRAGGDALRIRAADRPQQDATEEQS
jgi:hypothetical protein